MLFSFIISLAWSLEAACPCQCHGADGRGAGAGEQTADALLLDDVAQRVDDAGVVAALVHREGLIGLHADEGEIRGGAEHGSEAASGETSASFLREGRERPCSPP